MTKQGRRSTSRNAKSRSKSKSDLTIYERLFRRVRSENLRRLEIVEQRRDEFRTRLIGLYTALYISSYIDTLLCILSVESSHLRD